ncbi:MAG: aromatic ring-hydroxylating dioxygenase subunit alpha [Gammaproteobacteria bacterium]|nr:aromatic ring-hydroxylating dioxygenase subunit alpha [Gammaproteobacteria bacterium]
MKTGTAPIHKIEAKAPPERYARGWHCLGLASDYKGGKPHSLNIFGTRLVVFQGADGRLNILDAWCPHMGADLGIGEVKGDSVVCKFHGWSWGGDGVCNHIPYAKRIPPKARIKSWPTLEENRMLFVWNDPEGNPPPPEVRIPRIAPVFSGEWSDWSIVKWTIHNNCRELIDNIADMAHFGPVHGGSGVVYFANIFDAHKATQVMVGTFENLGGKDDYLTTVASYYGPAYQITHMFGSMQGYPVESILLNSHTPITPNSFDLRFGVMVKKFPGMSKEACDAMVKQYVDMTNKAFGEDVQIWHNKVRVDNAMLCDGDGPIVQNRQWYEQFYLDAAAVPPQQKARRVVEIDKGVLKEKPRLVHAFDEA